MNQTDNMSNWIKVSERLPEEGVVVNVHDSYGFTTTAKWVPYMKGSKHFHWVDYRGYTHTDNDDITHWQPLPGPPQTDNKQ